MTVFDVVLVVVSVTVVATIILYATWLLVRRLRSGQPKVQSFREWLKHIFEAIWGL